MNEVVCSYATIRKTCVIRISVFIVSVPKIIDMYIIYKKKNQTLAIGTDGNV
jgi:hypothetical protein